MFIDIDTADENGKHKSDARRNVYDRDMNLLPCKVSRDTFPAGLVSKPRNYIEMRDIAEKLSHPFPFTRVDLYNVDGKIIFGEITFFHSGGLSVIEPEKWAFKLGQPISIEYAKKDMKRRFCYSTK